MAKGIRINKMKTVRLFFALLFASYVFLLFLISYCVLVYDICVHGGHTSSFS